MLDFIKNIGAYIITWCIVVTIFAVPLSLYSYLQRYTTIDNKIAERGLWFTNTIDLSAYKYIGSGSGLFGNYDSYSRSDRHETISVYKD